MSLNNYWSRGAFIELLSGQVTLLFGALSTSLPSIKTGKLKGFGVTSALRTPVAPELPTIAESGLPGYEALQWFGIAVPKATEKKGWTDSVLSLIGS